MEPPDIQAPNIQALFSSIVLRELQKLEQASKMEFSLTEDQLECLVALAKILKASPEIAEAEAPALAMVGDLEEALKLVGKTSE